MAKISDAARSAAAKKAWDTRGRGKTTAALASATRMHPSVPMRGDGTPSAQVRLASNVPVHSADTQYQKWKAMTPAERAAYIARPPKSGTPGQREQLARKLREVRTMRAASKTSSGGFHVAHVSAGENLSAKVRGMRLRFNIPRKGK